MEVNKSKLKEFINYSQSLKGDEKGEAQVFCDRLFQAFGHLGYKEAGAVLEYRVKSKGNKTKFADLVWEDKMIIEMKKRGVILAAHRNQLFDYWWKLRPNQPKYCILCNFDEFYIYNFSIQDDPLDKILISDLEESCSALNFLFPVYIEPIFNNNKEEATREAVSNIARLYNNLIKRNVEPEYCQRFILQCIFSMFAEDLGLLPYDFFTNIVHESIKTGNSYDLIGGLFNQMNNSIPARGGKYKGIQYFNGGLFSIVYPIELTNDELMILYECCIKKWTKVNPGIFGTIFQQSMNQEDRHAYGAHFTSEEDIYKIVKPTIIDPWKEKIKNANTLKELKNLIQEIRNFKVLDPACGSGNFLYIAFRELTRLEMEILDKAYMNFTETAAKSMGMISEISPKQFYGIDNSLFAVELTKVTLFLAKELSLKETKNWLSTNQSSFDVIGSELPLDNLDDNVLNLDSLFCEWPKVDVIIGNPPFQSKNKMQTEFGIEYVNKLHEKYKEIPGRADFCVYWFYKAHNEMRENSCAGLVGTNTIRQNYSRIGGLDHIVNHGGTIYNAVSSEPWSGDAVVYVSIVCWKKGLYPQKKELYFENENKYIEKYDLDFINSSLSIEIDLSNSKILQSSINPKKVFQGQTHGHEGFLISRDKAKEIIKIDTNYNKILKPYLTGEEFLNNKSFEINRYVIDYTFMDINKASKYEMTFKIISKEVLPDRKLKAELQENKNGSLLKINPNARVNKHHINFYNNWWKLSYGREDMLNSIRNLKRYIAIPQVSKRPIFDFVSSKINPNAALMVFAFQDDYSFGILQSICHIKWYHGKCSTLKGDPRYTTNSVWDTFPWPQNPSNKEVENVASTSRNLREIRRKIMKGNNWNLRDLYRIYDKHGKNVLKDIHRKLDNAVIKAYGFDKKQDILIQLLNLNKVVSEKEQNNEYVTKPGIPDTYKNVDKLTSTDCFGMEVIK